MKLKNTDLSIPDPFYECPVCKLDPEIRISKKVKGYCNIGNLVLHIKRKHTEHYFGDKKKN